MWNRQIVHCVKSVRIRSYCGPHFSAFGLNTERRSIFPYSVRMQENVDQNTSEYGHFLGSDRGVARITKNILDGELCNNI